MNYTKESGVSLTKTSFFNLILGFSIPPLKRQKIEDQLATQFKKVSENDHFGTWVATFEKSPFEKMFLSAELRQSVHQSIGGRLILFLSPNFSIRQPEVYLRFPAFGYLPPTPHGPELSPYFLFCIQNGTRLEFALSQNKNTVLYVTLDQIQND